MADNNPSQNRPASPKEAPDPATAYERAKPEKEAGAGRLDNNIATPTDHRGHIDQDITNRRDPTRQINAEDDAAGTGGSGPPSGHIDLTHSHGRPAPRQPDHSMHEEEPDGWDQAPTDIADPQAKRHPRTGGKGGTPDAGESERSG